MSILVPNPIYRFDFHRLPLLDISFHLLMFALFLSSRSYHYCSAIFLEQENFMKVLEAPCQDGAGGWRSMPGLTQHTGIRQLLRLLLKRTLHLQLRTCFFSADRWQFCTRGSVITLHNPSPRDTAKIAQIQSLSLMLHCLLMVRCWTSFFPLSVVLFVRKRERP